mmetsp:Transcript_12963/g.35560  ORF Transcript_12963/g.35560 Transcript_12963/m.35560 type:complete len:143 (-) Transcript_12963:12-440(-)
MSGEAPSTEVELHPSMREYLEALVADVSGLHAIVISNSYGVGLVTVVGTDAPETLDTAQIERLFSPVFAMGSDQAEKLPFGSPKASVAFYDHMLLVQIDNCPLVLTLVGAPDANVGSILAKVPELTRALEPVRAKADVELLE